MTCTPHLHTTQYTTKQKLIGEPGLAPVLQLTEFEMATANRPAHMTGAVSPKRTSLKLRSRSNSPNPRAMPYTDVKTQRRRTHSSSLAHTTSAAPAAIRPATRAGFRERCHTTPDRPARWGWEREMGGGGRAKRVGERVKSERERESERESESDSESESER